MSETTKVSRNTVLITGSSRGLGRSIALAFASKGCNVIVHGRDKESLKSLRRAISRHRVDCHMVIGELTDEMTIDDLTRCAEETNIDILINNAGMYLNKPVDEMSLSEFKKVIDVNLVAPVLLSKNIYNLFRKKTSGLIININSIAGKNSSAGESAYCASKFGLRGFMGSLKFESLKYNVVVLDVFLGAMNTDMTVNRSNSDKFINKDEAAKFIYQLSENYSSLRVNEIEILRKLY